MRKTSSARVLMVKSGSNQHPKEPVLLQEVYKHPKWRAPHAVELFVAMFARGIVCAWSH